MKTAKKFLTLAFMALLFMGCVVDDENELTNSSDSSSDTSSSSKSSSDSTEITAVAISGSSSISYNATITLTATATSSGSPTITYAWEITSGESYASLVSTSGESVKLRANNTSASVQTVKVKVTATNSGNSSNVVSSEVHAINVAANGETVADKITEVTLSANAETIAAAGKATLTAAATYTGSPTIEYAWEITTGSDYATLSATSGTSVKLTGNNTDSDPHDVTVQVTATNADDSTNSCSKTLSFSVAAKGTFSGILYINLTDGEVSVDDSAYTDITTSKTTFGNDEVTVKYTKDNGVSTGLIKIDAQSYEDELTVYLSGTMTTGGVKIQSNGTDAVNVYLTDVSITSSNYPCIDITKGSAANVYLSGTNTLKDGRSYGTGYGEEYSTTSGATYTDDDGNTVSCTVVKAAVSEGSDSKGTLFSKGNLTISGSGSLSVTQAYKNCIASKATLTINSGTYTLTSTGKNGLFADESVVVNDGTITFNGTGTVSTTALRKTNGIKADSDNSSSTVYINGGTISVTAYNGKGFAASKVYVAGGTNTINVTGTSGYTNDNKKTGYYYTADGEKVTCSGGTSGYITCAPEGIEGASLVQISGGKTTVSAQDDGINVSDKGAQFVMSDGYLYVTATNGDGIDSNGDISVSGGYIVSIATTGSEDALDWADSQMDGYNGSCKITGGYIAGVSGSAESPASVSNAGVVIMSPSISAGSSIAIGSSTSDIGFAFTVPSGVSSSSSKFFMCSPNLTGSSYTVYKGCTLSDGANWNGLYYSMPTISSSGTTSSVTLSSHISSSSSSSTPGGNQGGPGGSSGGRR